MAQQTQKPSSAKPDSNGDGKQAEQAAEAAVTRKAEEAARVKAEQLRSAAERDAQKIRKAADEAAEKIKKDARAEADKIKRAAEAEARKTRKAIEAEARRTELANREAREAEQAARDEADRIAAAAEAAAAHKTSVEPTWAVDLAREQLETATKLTQAMWEQNLALAAGVVPAYLDVYEQTLAGFAPFSRASRVTQETAEAGVTVARELLNV